ncbi:hypothetical protein [Agromyces humi]|uniref:hypothetical protein n=1 Tax=Agromyces humi TaxID=1766800 RepID=UPI001357B7F6|nr:hypothetical protein [Agromyces humi]
MNGIYETRRVLVTGGTGSFGHTVAERMLGLGVAQSPAADAFGMCGRLQTYRTDPMEEPHA